MSVRRTPKRVDITVVWVSIRLWYGREFLLSLPMQLKVVLTAENSSERARTHLRRLRDRMRCGQLSSDGLVLTIETAEDVEAFWRDIVQPHSVLNLQRYQYFYHMLLRGCVRGTFDCCQKEAEGTVDHSCGQAQQPPVVTSCKGTA